MNRIEKIIKWIFYALVILFLLLLIVWWFLVYALSPYLHEFLLKIN